MDLSSCSAMVADSNLLSRSILVTQLRELGIGKIIQTGTVVDARQQLEIRKFDFILSEQHFKDGNISGKDLLDDLRRNNLLPFSSVFIMVTGEASYDWVAESIESALDGYLLKPHRANDLKERLYAARTRKLEFQEIFNDIESGRFDVAVENCIKKFKGGGKFWLYAGRIAAELLVRLNRHDDAREIYEVISQAKALPWARLGIAVTQLGKGESSAAFTTLGNIINENPKYTDAYDVMGRAQFEQGKFAETIETYKKALDLTPSSITRIQSLGLMQYYTGNFEGAQELFEKAIRIGLKSKMFDSQSLVLLSFIYVKSQNKKGIKQCHVDMVKLIDSHKESGGDESLKLIRSERIIYALYCLKTQRFNEYVQHVQGLMTEAERADFDFESASNLLTLMALSITKNLELEYPSLLVERIGFRFCSSRPLSDILASSSYWHEPYSEQIRNCQKNVFKMVGDSMRHSIEGNHKQAIQLLINHGRTTMNSRFAHNAIQLLTRHEDKIDDANTLHCGIESLKDLLQISNSRIGAMTDKRQSGGMLLKVNPQNYQAAK